MYCIFSIASERLSVEINALLTIISPGMVVVSMIFAAYMALLVVLGLIEVWALRAIAQEFSRQNGRKRVRAERQEIIIARRLWRVGGRD